MGIVEFENNYLHAWVDKGIGLIYSEWLRPVSSKEYREGNLILIDLLKEHYVVNWIADSSKIGEVSQEDEIWTLNELVPLSIKTGLRRIARVSGEDKSSFPKFETFVGRAQDFGIGHIQVRQFMTYKESADWIGEIST